MCVRTIMDANVLAEVASGDPSQSFESLIAWFDRGDGLLIYTDDEEFMTEMLRARGNWKRLVSRYRQSNQMVRAAAPQVAKAKRDIAANPLRSRRKDVHLLALARVAEAAVLCTDDQGLKADFTNKQVLPRLPGRDRAVYPLPPPGERDRPASRNMRQAQRRFLDSRQCPRKC